MVGGLAEGTAIHFQEGIAVIVGAVKDTAVHSHHAIQASLSFEDEMSLESGGEESSTFFALIPPERKHRLRGSGKPQVLILVEPESAWGDALLGYLQRGGLAAPALSALEIERLRAAVEREPFSFAGVMDALFAALGMQGGKRSERDPRIDRAIAIIADCRDKRIRIPRLAAMVNLSQSRLQHLFREKTGISLKKYLLWKRMIDAVGILAKGRDLTFGSLEAGFFDLSHLSRNFKAMFGMSPRAVFKDSASVQVFRQ
jgi:AraC-like DNA-binding protein